MAIGSRGTLFPATKRGQAGGLMLHVRAAVYLLAMAIPMAGARGDDAMSPFGIGSDAARNRSVDAYAKWIAQMAAIGITVLRTPDSSWGVSISGFNFVLDSDGRTYTRYEIQKVTVTKLAP